MGGRHRSWCVRPQRGLVSWPALASIPGVVPLQDARDTAGRGSSSPSGPFISRPDGCGAERRALGRSCRQQQQPSAGGECTFALAVGKLLLLMGRARMDNSPILQHGDVAPRGTFGRPDCGSGPAPTKSRLVRASTGEAAFRIRSSIEILASRFKRMFEW
jgi:hypothetical protein